MYFIEAYAFTSRLQGSGDLKQLSGGLFRRVPRVSRMSPLACVRMSLGLRACADFRESGGVCFIRCDVRLRQGLKGSGAEEEAL